MGCTFKDILTGEELTKENFIRCLDGYLNSVTAVNASVTVNLLLYMERALEVGGADLANVIIGRVMADLYCLSD